MGNLISRFLYGHWPKWPPIDTQNRVKTGENQSIAMSLCKSSEMIFRNQIHGDEFRGHLAGLVWGLVR